MKLPHCEGDFFCMLSYWLLLSKSTLMSSVISGLEILSMTGSRREKR